MYTTLAPLLLLATSVTADYNGMDMSASSHVGPFHSSLSGTQAWTAAWT
jgi:hypothetical protein